MKLMDPPNNEEEVLLRAIRQAVNNSDGDLLERSTALAPVLSYTVVSESGPNKFSDRIFGLILQVLDEDAFLQMQDSHHLLLMLQYEWEMLSAQQKEMLLPRLEAAFGRFHYWLSSFVITEILGEYFANKNALDCACRLESQNELQHRQLLPHAFEHLVRSSSDDGVKSTALDRLWAMTKDSSPNVAREATLSLARLGIKSGGL